MVRIINLLLSTTLLLSLLSLSVMAQEENQVPETQVSETQVTVEAAQEATEIDTDISEGLAETRTVLSAEDINPIELNYTVAGESDAFLNDVENAFMTWQDASVGAIEARQSEDALVTFMVADESLLGPDVISLKITERSLTTNAESSRLATSVLIAEAIRESSPNSYKSALLHEVGVLVGLPLTDEGVMQRGLTEAIVPSVSVSEARALETQASAAKEDINRDGQVDFYDLVELARNYVEFPQNLSADITSDGAVDGDDVIQLQNAYRFSDPVDSIGLNGTDLNNTDLNNTDANDIEVNDTEVNDTDSNNTDINSTDEVTENLAGSEVSETVNSETVIPEASAGASSVLGNFLEQAAQRAQEARQNASQEQDTNQNSDGQ